MKKPKNPLSLPPGGVNKVVLHSCCAPCSAAIIEWLLAHGVQPLIYYFNPNIFPIEEYLQRKNELTRLADQLHLTVIDGDNDHQTWRKSVIDQQLQNEPERGARCQWCFDMRMDATAKIASEVGIPVFTTTLASSRWKDIAQINSAGIKAANAYPGTIFWEQNWRKGGLTQRRAELVRQYDFYRQDYCGCEFSMRHLIKQSSED